MTAQLIHLSRLSENHYQVGIEADAIVRSYVVHLEDVGFHSLSGPHSFWEAFGDRSVVSTIVECINKLGTKDELALPIELHSIAALADDRPERPPTWASRSARWYLAPESLRWASRHLLSGAHNTLFPVPFEHTVISQAIDELTTVAGRVDLCGHTLREHRQLLVPKSASGVRPGTQLSPLDSLLLTAAVYEFGEVVERSRIPLEDEAVHSFRYAPSAKGDIWAETIGYESYQQRTQEVLEDGRYPFVAETDIASFYHQIDPAAVGAALERIGVNLKSAFAVQRMLVNSPIGGLPVGPSVSALLAESLLVPIDTYLRSKQVAFTRFNDDYRIFCRSESHANSVLQGMAGVLWESARLTLQTTKTRVSESEAVLERLVKGAWLNDLRGQVTSPDYAFLDSDPAPDQSLVYAARELLEEAIDPDHPAWSNICRRVFMSLPLSEKEAELPRLLSELPRIWALAPQLSRTIIALSRSQSERSPLLEMVSDRLKTGIGNLPDYSGAWLLNTFGAGDWGHGVSLLATLDLAIDHNQPATRRELLLALRGTDLANGIQYETRDPWQVRARMWATGIAGNQPNVTDPSDPCHAWTEALSGLILEGARHPKDKL